MPAEVDPRDLGSATDSRFWRGRKAAWEACVTPDDREAFLSDPRVADLPRASLFLRMRYA